MTEAARIAPVSSSAPNPVFLSGMTWSHMRGYLPLIATAQRFSELNAGVNISWEKRTLEQFEAFPVERIASKYDLVVVDHPFVGELAKNRALLPLDDLISRAFLRDQSENSLGFSHSSYTFAGRQWALAIDAAAPVAFWRDDLMALYGLKVPQSWEDTMQLARGGRVEVPAAPIYCLMNFYAACIAFGEEPFLSTNRVVRTAVGYKALSALRDLLSLCDPVCWSRNPISSLEWVASAENSSTAYCPFAYGYSNYARNGYAAHRLSFGEPPWVNGVPFRTTLGGTGLAISAQCIHRKEALAYVKFVASPAIQTTLYVQAGGQPAHRAAWISNDSKKIAGHFFLRTLPAIDRAWLRPRYRGYIDFQAAASPVVHAALRGDKSDRQALEEIDTIYRASLARADVFQ